MIDRTLKSNYYNYSQSHTSPLSLALFTHSFSHALYTYRSKCGIRKNKRRKLLFILRHMVYFFLFSSFSRISTGLVSVHMDVVLLFLLSDVHLTFTSDTIHFEGIILIVTMLTL